MKIPRNPYLNRSMIRTPGAFIGRRRELARAAARLAAEPPQSVAIVGDRRVGKSSFLYHLSRPEVAAGYLDEPERTLFLLLDFQEEQRPTVESFIRAVSARIQAALPGFGVPMPESYEGLQQAVRHLSDEGYRLVLLLDEFDRVTRNSRFDAGFFAFLRSLASHHDLAYVTASTRPLQELCHTEEISDSPFFNIFSTLRLGPFPPEEARELIRIPSEATSLPLEPHAELILDLAGYLPFFLQLAAAATFEVLVEEGQAGPSAVEARFLEEARPHYQFYWDQMGPVERALCNDAAVGRLPAADRPERVELVQRGFLQPDGRLFARPFAGFVRQSYANEVGEQPVEVQAARMRTMELELEKARQMQLALMPAEAPRVPGLDLAGRCEPASHVGGDFYTYLWLGGERSLLAVVGVDVMGHGMEGAVTAVRFSEILRYEVRDRTRPAEILAGLGRALRGTLPRGAFVGCGITVLDLAQGQAEVAVAGYHPPLWFRHRLGRVVGLDLGGTPLGIGAAPIYDSQTLSLEPGDLLLIHSDGVIEATDDRDDLYGEERLQELLVAAVAEGLDAVGLLSRLYWDVGRFTASAGQRDDMTAIALRITGEKDA